MTNVVDFNPEKKKPHWTGEAQCRCDPGHRWVAVVPCSGNPWLLECPKGCGMSGHINVQAENSYEARKWAEEIWNVGRGETIALGVGR